MPSTDPEGLEAYFTDVEDLLLYFRQAVAVKPLPRRLLIIHGIGGVGKTAVLSMFRLHCKREHIPVALASGDEPASKGVAGILSSWVSDLQTDRVRLPATTRTLRKYRTIQASVQVQARKAQDTRHKVADLTSQSFARLTDDAAAVMGAAIGSAIPGSGTLGGTLGGVGAEMLIDWLRGFLDKSEIDLLLDPVEKMTRDFLTDTARIASKGRLVLLLDAFDQLTALDRWTCDLAHRLAPNVLLVIAGRAMVNWDRYWPGWLAHARVEQINPMSQENMRTLVHRYHKYTAICDRELAPAQVEEIIRFARGLPMGVTSAVRLWAKYRVENFPTIKPEVVPDLVDCLLKGVPAEMRPGLEAAAVLRYFDVPLLRMLLDGPDHWRDIYSPYVDGLGQLLERLKDHPSYMEVLGYQQRLLENIAKARQEGETRETQADRAAIISQLDRLAISALGVPFSSGICQPLSVAPAAQSALSRSWDAATLYDDLRRWPFVHPQPEGLALHASVRDILDEDLRLRAPERHRELHRRAAVHFGQLMAKESGEKAEQLGRERLYHYVRVDENAGVQLFQKTAEELVRFRLLHSLRTLLNDMHTYPLESANSRLWRQYYQARLLHLKGQLSDAENLYDEICRAKESEPKLRAYALSAWGEILARYERLGQRGGVDAAVRKLQESLGLGIQDSHVSESLLNLAHVAGFKGCWDEQAEYLEMARDAFAKQGDNYGVVRTYVEIQRAQARRGIWRDVFQANREGLAALGQTAVRSGALEAKLLGKWVWAWALAGRLAECERNGRKSLAIMRDLEDDISTLQILRDIGWAIAAQGRYTEADQHFRESLDIAERLGLDYEIGATTGFWGAALRWSGRIAQAEELLIKCLRIKEDAHETPGMLEPLTWLGTLYEQRSQFDEAAKHYQRYEEWKWYGRLYFQCAALTGLVRVEYARENYDAVGPLLVAAESLAQEYEYNDHLASLRLTQGHAAWEGDVPGWDKGMKAALQYYREALIYGLRYNRFLLDEVLSGRPEGTPLRPIIPCCLAHGEEGRRLLTMLADWWAHATNDTGTPRPDTIALCPEGVPLLEAERIAREAEPGEGRPQRSVIEQIRSALATL